MKTILQIAQLGEPILRELAQPVIDITDPIFQQLIDSLIATSINAKGVGIAAPQVSESYRLFIISSHPNPRYPNAPLMEPTAIINPKIIDYSQEIVKGWEGCLSVPGLRGLVPRYQTIVVEYLDRNGHLQHQELTDFVARIFQHELDHLNGLIFLDRVENDQDLYSEEEFQQLIINNG